MLVNSKKFLSFSLNCDGTLREWTGQSMKLFLVYSTDLALKVTVCIRWQNLLELFFFSMLVFVLFCFLSFVVICLFISCFLLFCFFYYFCYFVTWYTKRNTLLKFSKGNALNEALKLNGVCCLLRDSFFSVYRHGGNFPTAMIKKQVPFLFFYTTIQYSENRADVRQSCSKWSIIWKARWFD